MRCSFFFPFLDLEIVSFSILSLLKDQTKFQKNIINRKINENYTYTADIMNKIFFLIRLQ